ncbi:hypothetical protein N7488_009832 [Penicillium malachiteum]|nr:hypothetical protein N7488_009832 [Penicillium malachiteum]
MPRCAARLAGNTFPLGAIYTVMKGFCINSIIPIRVHVHFAIPPLQESHTLHAEMQCVAMQVDALREHRGIFQQLHEEGLRKFVVCGALE